VGKKNPKRSAKDVKKPFEYPETDDEMEELGEWRSEALERRVKSGKRMPARSTRPTDLRFAAEDMGLVMKYGSLFFLSVCPELFALNCLP
jgi:hypothetical protein